ncbi:DUF4139 domain-containing protein [candidate division KSB1 bacterium]|nr:DUF4139 domain-containing protein [candidate division KSB1 bacterium]
MNNTLPSQTNEIALTVYNDNLALVKDIRAVSLQTGIQLFKFLDVAAQIDPTSVHFKSLTAPDKISILEQNYEFDLISATKLMQKYVDQEIKVITKESTSQGKLLSASQSEIMLQEPAGAIRVVNQTAILNLEFPKLPDGLITRPTLVWSLQNQKAGDHKIELSYLTRGISWHAEYVAVSEANDTQLELSGWVSIDNQSGASYQNAKLKLVAGEVHQVEPELQYAPMRTMRVAEDAAGAAGFEEKEFFEYHLYTLQRPATVKDNQIKQISLFPTATTKVNKLFIFDGQFYPKKVRVHLEFKNSKQDGLGMPLPEGKIRVYKEDPDDKSLEFVGEDEIQHTPKDELVRIFLGNAFDVVGERLQKEEKQLGKRATEEAYEIKLRNHKSTDVEVTVVEHAWGEWEIKSENYKHIKRDANKFEYKVQVPKDGETVVNYVIQKRW